jgi:hypothetical protein
MAQHDYVIDNQSFPATRSDLNSLFQAIASCNSGATAPSTTYANQLWYDTANNKLYIRNEDNDAWIELFVLDQTGDHLEKIGNTITLDGTGNMSLAGDLTVDTNTLFVDSTNNRVGVGTTSPTQVMTVKTATDANFIMLNDSGVRLQATNDAGTSLDTLKVAGSPLIFLGSGGAETARILSGGGLTFNGDTATTNALDDYEKGDWTPAYSISGASRGQRSGGSGDLQLTGLPYATSSATNLNQAATIGFTKNWSVSPRGALTGINSTVIVFRKSGSTSALSNITDDVTHSDVSTTSTSSNDLILTVAYVAA